MDLSTWDIALLYTYAVVSLPVTPLIYTYKFAKRQYKRSARMIYIQSTHNKAWRKGRNAREKANRSHHFLRLPPELRNRIYRLSMVSDAVVDPIWGSIHDLTPLDGKQHHLRAHNEYPTHRSELYDDDRRFEPSAVVAARMANMSQVCKVWRAEAVRSYYGNNIFKFPIGEGLWQQKKKNKGLGLQTSAVRKYYVNWFLRLPREAFPVLRLVLLDYRKCPHPFAKTVDHTPTETGRCMVFIDFQRQVFAALTGDLMPRCRDLWHCEICWRRYVDVVWGLNESEEMRELFARFEQRLNAAAATRVVDRMRFILGKKLEEAAKAANDSWA